MFHVKRRGGELPHSAKNNKARFFQDKWALSISSRPFPDCRQVARFRAVGLRNDKAAGLRGVKDAAVADDSAKAFAGVDGRAGGDELAVLRKVNHVHVRAEDVGLGHGEAAAGVVVADAGDDLAGLVIVHVALAAKCV